MITTVRSHTFVDDQEVVHASPIEYLWLTYGQYIFRLVEAVIEVPRRADEGEVREGLGKITQMFAAWPQLFGIET